MILNYDKNTHSGERIAAKPTKKLVLKLTSVEERKNKDMKDTENTNFNIMNLEIFRWKRSSKFKTSAPNHLIS